MSLDLQHPWNIVFLVGFAFYVGIRHRFATLTKGERSVVRRVDGLEKSLMLLVALGGLLVPVLYLFTPWLGFADYRLPAFVPWIGAAVMPAALWLFWRSHADLGRHWSMTLEVRDGHRLVSHGVYRRIRHPMYLAIWSWSLAQALLLENWLAGFAALASFAPMYFLRTPREERLMCEALGDEYREYMTRTGRIVPPLSRRPESRTGGKPA